MRAVTESIEHFVEGEASHESTEKENSSVAVCQLRPNVLHDSRDPIFKLRDELSSHESPVRQSRGSLDFHLRRGILAQASSAAATFS